MMLGKNLVVGPEAVDEIPGKRDRLGGRGVVTDLHDEQEAALAAEDPMNLGKGPIEIIDVVERVEARDDVEMTGRKRQGFRGRALVGHLVAADSKFSVVVDQWVNTNPFNRVVCPLETSSWTAPDVKQPLPSIEGPLKPKELGEHLLVERVIQRSLDGFALPPKVQFVKAFVVGRVAWA